MTQLAKSMQQAFERAGIVFNGGGVGLALTAAIRGFADSASDFTHVGSKFEKLVCA
jgi:hypothetical protein